MYCHQCGKEIPDSSTFCPYCGVALNSMSNQYQTNQQSNTQYNGEKDEPNIGFAILSFFVPIAGIVLYFVWRNEFPKKAKSCLKGFVGSIVLYVVIFCCMISMFIGMASSTYGNRDYYNDQNYDDYYDEDYNFDEDFYYNSYNQPLI